MNVLDEEFRDVGFTGEARNYPRDEFALVLFAAFNNVTVEQLKPAQRYHPNGATEAAWKRVADAAKRHIKRKKNEALRTGFAEL